MTAFWLALKAGLGLSIGVLLPLSLAAVCIGAAGLWRGGKRFRK